MLLLSGHRAITLLGAVVTLAGPVRRLRLSAVVLGVAVATAAAWPRGWPRLWPQRTGASRVAGRCWGMASRAAGRTGMLE